MGMKAGSGVHAVDSMMDKDGNNRVRDCMEAEKSGSDMDPVAMVMEEMPARAAESVVKNPVHA